MGIAKGRNAMGRLTTSWDVRSCLRGACAAAALLVATAAANAQEINWRYDYNTARRESQQKSKPLLIDFNTDNCFWCVKLDTDTFRNPTIIGLVNENFTPLKVNA